MRADLFSKATILDALVSFDLPALFEENIEIFVGADLHHIKLSVRVWFAADAAPVVDDCGGVAVETDTCEASQGQSLLQSDCSSM